MDLTQLLKKSALIVVILAITEPALATQAHSAPEGLYAHQLAHIFFIISMGVLTYWLRERKLVQAVGWRHIQYSALFFILWNVDAFFVHLVEEQIVDSPVLVWLYYAAKLDHLLCVPALLFLFFGLRRLLRDAETSTIRTVKPWS